MDRKIHPQITLSKARQIAESNGVNVSVPTLLQWIRDNNLGHQPGGAGGKWYIHKQEFINFIKGRN